MKVLVTGGTGFVGNAVLRELRNRGHQIRALVRDPGSSSSRKIHQEFGAELIAGDILDPASVLPSLAEMDAIIHLVGIIGEVGRNTFEAVHHRGTANMVAAAREKRVRRFIHMSALGTRPDAVSRYHQSKWAGEEVVRKSGLYYTIFRPSIIYGPGDAFTTMFARLIRAFRIAPVIGNGNGTVQPLPVEVVARCFAAALSTPSAIGETVDLVGPEILTMNEVMDRIVNATGKGAIKLHLPLFLARANALLLEVAWPRLLRRPAPLNRDQIIMLQEQTNGDAGLARQLFQMEAPPFAVGLAYLGAVDNR